MAVDVREWLGWRKVVVIVAALAAFTLFARPFQIAGPGSFSCGNAAVALTGHGNERDNDDPHRCRQAAFHRLFRYEGGVLALGLLLAASCVPLGREKRRAWLEAGR